MVGDGFCCIGASEVKSSGHKLGGGPREEGGGGRSEMSAGGHFVRPILKNTRFLFARTRFVTLSESIQKAQKEGKTPNFPLRGSIIP